MKEEVLILGKTKIDKNLGKELIWKGAGDIKWKGGGRSINIRQKKER